LILKKYAEFQKHVHEGRNIIFMFQEIRNRISAFPAEYMYRYVPHDDVSINNGLHIQQWFHKIVML